MTTDTSKKNIFLRRSIESDVYSPLLPLAICDCNRATAYKIATVRNMVDSLIPSNLALRATSEFIIPIKRHYLLEGSALSNFTHSEVANAYDTKLIEKKLSIATIEVANHAITKTEFNSVTVLSLTTGVFTKSNQIVNVSIKNVATLLEGVQVDMDSVVATSASGGKYLNINNALPYLTKVGIEYHATLSTVRENTVWEHKESKSLFWAIGGFTSVVATVKENNSTEKLEKTTATLPK